MPSLQKLEFSVAFLTYFLLQYLQRTFFVFLRTAKIINYLFRPKKSFKKRAFVTHIFPKSGCKDKQLFFYSPN